MDFSALNMYQVTVGILIIALATLHGVEARKVPSYYLIQEKSDIPAAFAGDEKSIPAIFSDMKDSKFTTYLIKSDGKKSVRMGSMDVKEVIPMGLMDTKKQKDSLPMGILGHMDALSKSKIPFGLMDSKNRKRENTCQAALNTCTRLLKKTIKDSQK